MNIRLTKIILTLGVASVFSLSSAGTTIQPGGQLFILGSKTLNPETKTKHNLDVFLGNASLTLSAKGDNFEGFTEVVIFPAGYGFSYIEAAILDSATNKIVSKKSDESKVVIANAYGRYKGKFLQADIGRATLKYANGFFFGDYLHRGSGPIIDYGGSTQNFLQFKNTTKAFTTSILLGANDINLDRGYLTFREVIKPVDMFELGIGYEGNIFDPIQIDDAEVLNNISINTKIGYIKGQSIFGEFGMRGLGAKNDDNTRFPFMLGLTIPTGNLLNTLAAEIEYDSKRLDVDNLCAFEYGFYAIKEFGPHFKTILSLNNGTAKKAGIVGLNLEMVIGF